jgi:hypothetical protein
LKRLSIFIVFIFLVTILFVNYHHSEDKIIQDNSLFFDTVDDNPHISTNNIDKVLLTDRFVAIIIIEKKIFSPRILTCKFISRAPPA